MATNPTLGQQLKIAKALVKKEQKEKVERGKELAKLTRLIDNFKAFLPDGFVAETRNILSGYETRCETDNYRKARQG